MSFKHLYGEVMTPESIINTLINQLPIWDSPNIHLTTWLDPCVGKGQFTLVIYHKLMDVLKHTFPNVQQRSHHILTKMLYMIEINSAHKSHLYDLFPYQKNISIQDFLQPLPNHFPKHFDIIIGNPPYQVNGMKPVPTQRIKTTTTKPKTMWTQFVRRSFELLQSKGYMSMIIPAIWLKPDKANIYSLLTSHNILHIHTLTNQQTNKLFKGQAQTPTTMITVQNAPHTQQPIMSHGLPVKERKTFKILLNKPIPLCYFSLVDFIISWMKQQQIPSLFNYVYKTNPVPKEYLSKEPTKYINIHTCVFKNKAPYLVKSYSIRPLQFQGVPKIIMAHKMYGCPYLDKQGTFGISSRDNYIIRSTNTILLLWLEQPIITKLIDTTRYRMSYFEKYCFHWIPYITTKQHFYTFYKDLQNSKIERLSEKYIQPSIVI